jgi:hypothetical protein
VTPGLLFLQAVVDEPDVKALEASLSVGIHCTAANVAKSILTWQSRRLTKPPIDCGLRAALLSALLAE